MNETTDQQWTDPAAEQHRSSGSTSGPTPDPTTEPGAGSVFDGLRRLGIWRGEGWIGGVCEGIAERLRVDPLVVRGAAILFGMLAGFGVVLYLAAWALFPDRSGRIHAEEAVLRRAPRSAGLLALVAILLTFAVIGTLASAGPPAVVGLIGATVALTLVGVAFLRTPARSSTPPQPAAASAGGSAGSAQPPERVDPGETPDPVGAAPPGGRPTTPTTPTTGHGAPHDHPDPVFAEPQVRGPGGGRPPTGTAATPPPAPRRRGFGFGGTVFAAGLALIAGVLVRTLAHDQDWPGNAIAHGVAAAIGALALVLIVVGLIGRRAAGVSTLAALLLPFLLMTAVLPPGQGVSATAGERTWVVTSAADQVYELGAGYAVLDLRDIPIDPDADTSSAAGEPPTVTASVNVGNLDVLLPDGLVVEVTARAGGGEILVGEQREFGGWARMPERGHGRRAGLNVNETRVFGPAGAAQDGADVDLRLDLTISLGQLIIKEAAR